MHTNSVAFGALPVALKVAIGLFALHTLLYARLVLIVLSSGQQIYALWLIHIVVCGFLTTEIGRPRKSLFYVLVIYSVVVATNLLRTDYLGLPECPTEELLTLMWPTIAVCLPLYLAAVSLAFGRSFYLGPRAEK